MSRNENRNKTEPIMTVRIVPTRTLAWVEVDGVTKALPPGVTDATFLASKELEPFIPFTEYVADYVGPKEGGTLIVEPIRPQETVKDAQDRLRLKVLHWSEPHKVSAGGTPEDDAYWTARNAMRAKR